MRTLRTPVSALRPFLPRVCAVVIFGMASAAYCAAPLSDAPNRTPPVLAMPDLSEKMLMTPVPEPSTWLTLASGVGGLIGLQRFRRKTRG